MLKKYQFTGTRLSAKQLKEVKGGAGHYDSLQSMGCHVNADCGSPACTFPGEENCWVCGTIKGIRQCLWVA